MVKKTCFSRILAALGFSLFLLCGIFGSELISPADVLGVSLDTEGTGGGCNYSCTVNNLKVTSASSIESRYEFTGVCAYTPWGTGACPPPNNMKGKGAWFAEYKSAQEEISAEGYGGYYKVVTSASTCPNDPWINQNTGCTVAFLQTGYDALKPSANNPVKYPLSANQLTPAQRAALVSQANAIYVYYPQVPDVLQPTGSTYNAVDKVPIKIKPKDFQTSGIKFKWEQKTTQTAYNEKQVQLMNKQYAADGTLTAYVQLPAGTWHFKSAVDNPNGRWSDWKEFTVTPALPDPPTQLKATFPQDKPDRVVLSWHSNTYDASYYVSRKKKNGNYLVVGNVHNGLGYTDTDIETGQTYTYTVRLFKNNLYSEPSNEVTIFTSHPIHIEEGNTPPIKPSNLTATLIGSNSVKLNWRTDFHNSGSRKIDSFKIEYKAGSGNFSLLATVPQAGSVFTPQTYTHTGVTPNTYTYRVRSVNAAGESGFSNEATAGVSSAPLQPALKPGLKPSLNLK